MRPKRRRTSCANPDCRRPCQPRDRGLCDPCLATYRREHDRARIGTRERSHYAGGWRKRSKREIAAHIGVHGYTCPTCNDAHPETNPLSLDHVEARSLDGGTRVCCRKCNAKKGAKKHEL